MKTPSQPLPLQFPSTPQQVLGPYFLPQSPLKSVLFPSGAKGSSITIAGQVLSQACLPLASAVLHVWLADTAGAYDNQDTAGNPLVIPAAKQHYRGRIVADKEGKYSFDCLRPGNYYDGGAQLWRPAHIHVMVEAAGYTRLVTQLYFQDDAHNTHDIPGDDFFQPELVVQLAPAVASAGVSQSGVFNFVLASPPPAVVKKKK